MFSRNITFGRRFLLGIREVGIFAAAVTWIGTYDPYSLDSIALIAVLQLLVLPFGLSVLAHLWWRLK